MRLDANHDVVMRGPCEIRVIRGRVSILGLYSDYFILPDDTFSVSSHGDSEIETNCQYINTYPSLGLSNISDMIAMSGGKVVVLGELDAGKSYMSKTIYNTSDQFTYIDLDVGQSSLFLPTFVSSLRGTKLWFDTPLIFTETFFFGDISPSRDPKRHMEISIKLVENEKNVIIDTDGWLKGGGEVHKRDLISQIDPDYVICMGEETLKLVPKGYGQRILLVKRRNLNKKPRSLRQRKRRQAYRRYFESSNLLKPSNFGRRFNGGRFSCYDARVVNGLLVGLILGDKVVGAGQMVLDEDIGIRTPVAEFDDFVMGLVSLDENWRERRLF